MRCGGCEACCVRWTDKLKLDTIDVDGIALTTVCLLSPCAFSQALAVIIETGASKGMFSPNLTQIKVDIHMPIGEHATWPPWQIQGPRIIPLRFLRTRGGFAAAATRRRSERGGGRERTDHPPELSVHARRSSLGITSCTQCLCRRTFLSMTINSSPN